MIKLTNHQKKFLRSLGHSLHPIVRVGQQGLSASVLAEIVSTLGKHELLKIKIRTDSRAQKQKIIDQIVQDLNINLIQVIGNVVMIYRPFEQDRQIILPRR